jgi:ABC-2 type transport system ATP-binding protein
MQGLTKSYGQIQALRGVDLQVNRGEIYGFLGPNGAGKTTTIRCLIGLIRPQSGSIRVLGLDPLADSVAVRSRIGYLPGELSFEENLKVEAALRYLNALELLLLDEPTSGLDPLMQQEVHRLLKEAQADGTTVFFSSHIIGEVEAIAERVAIIRQGLIVEEAEPGQLGSMDLRRVHVRFAGPSDSKPLAEVPGVSMLDAHDTLNVTVQVEGELDDFIKALAAFPVSDLVIERPSLEEAFLAYYEGDRQESA